MNKRKDKVNNINPDWIKEKMEFFGVNQTELAANINTNYPHVNAMLNYRLNISKMAKANIFNFFEMLHFKKLYYECKEELEKREEKL